LGDRKGIRPAKSTASTPFLAHHDSMVAACHLQVRNTVTVTGHRRDAPLAQMVFSDGTRTRKEDLHNF